MGYEIITRCQQPGCSTKLPARLCVACVNKVMTQCENKLAEAREALEERNETIRDQHFQLEEATDLLRKQERLIESQAKLLASHVRVMNILFFAAVGLTIANVILAAAVGATE